MLIVALLSMFPGAVVGAGVTYGLFGHGPAMDIGVFAGAVLAAGIVMLGAMIPPNVIEERRSDSDTEQESAKMSS